MFTALVHIIWASLTTNASSDESSQFGHLHVALALFSAFLTRAWPLVMMLNIAACSDVNKIFYNSLCAQLLVKIGKNGVLCYMIGIGFPLAILILCLQLPGIPDKQTVIISIGKAQLITGNVYLFIIVASVFYTFIIISRASNNETTSFFALIGSSSRANSNKRTYYSPIKSSNGTARRPTRVLNQHESAESEEESNFLTVSIQHDATGRAEINSIANFFCYLT
jgi:hypothetical protein